LFYPLFSFFKEHKRKEPKAHIALWVLRWKLKVNKSKILISSEEAQSRTVTWQLAETAKVWV
jgi:hypothetical protein